MKRKFFSLSVSLILIGLIFCGCQTEIPAEKNEVPSASETFVLSPSEIFENCVNSTVHIETSSGGGTGFFIDEHIIVTNNHVIEGAGWITVKTSTGEIYNVTSVLARSENPDLAILETEATGSPVTINSHILREGDALYSIGAPMGIYPCISDGIVMKRNHNDMEVDYILSNIHSIGGNSGGPVFNAYGEVVGIVVGGMSDGPNSIDMIIDIKYIDSLDRNDPQPVGTKDEWLAEFNRPDEELYEEASIADAKVGQLVSFGKYEQNADDSDGTEDILWIVTEENGDTLTLMSLYCLDVVPYSLENTDTTWETSYLREFLNNDFYNSAFSIDEKNMIVDSEVINNDNPVHGTFGGNNTTDKVYIMSIEEAMEFYSVAEPVEMFYDHIHAQATEYAIQKGVWLEIPDSSRCWWWLRSPGGSASQAAEIGSAGYFSFNGSFVDSTERALRPVIKINR